MELDDQLAELDRAGLRRQLATRDRPQAVRIVLSGRTLINFGSNDYLGLAADPRLGLAVIEAIKSEGWGSGASPLLSGRSGSHERLEKRLAEFNGSPAALVFTSGYSANVGTLTAMAGAEDVIFSDAYNHASIIDGCRLARADLRIYPHGDWKHLQGLLKDSGDYRRRLIVTDSLFSMHGDLAPLVELADLAQGYNALLMVDEAHATGVFGERGRGVAEHLGVEDQIDIHVGTLSKALGSAGGFVCGSRSLIDWLVNRARPYVFSTAPPAALSAAAVRAVEIVDSEPHRRTELLQRTRQLRACLHQQGWNVAAEGGQIIPLFVGSADQAMHGAAWLSDQGFYVPGIRPPSVPAGQSLLRLSLNYGHTEEMIERLAASLQTLAANSVTSKANDSDPRG